MKALGWAALIFLGVALAGVIGFAYAVVIGVALFSKIQKATQPRRRKARR